MTKPLIYVAGPITGDPWGCVREAIEHVDNLRAAWDFNAYLPQLSVLHEMIQHRPYEFWIEHGLAMVERCDGVLRLSGDSPGADREVAHAEVHYIPVHRPGDNFQTFWAEVREWRRW